MFNSYKPIIAIANIKERIVNGPNEEREFPTKKELILSVVENPVDNSGGSRKIINANKYRNTSDAIIILLFFIYLKRILDYINVTFQGTLLL